MVQRVSKYIEGYCIETSPIFFIYKPISATEKQVDGVDVTSAVSFRLSKMSRETVLSTGYFIIQTELTFSRLPHELHDSQSGTAKKLGTDIHRFTILNVSLFNIPLPYISAANKITRPLPDLRIYPK